MTVGLADLSPCFQGVVPSMITTCDRTGEPNVTYLSQVHLVDDRHVALSCQFFNKTKRNVLENPYATVIVNHPVTFEAWRLRLRYQRAESEGPLFDAMAARIQVIATHTGMAGVFRLRSADVYEVLATEPLAGFLGPPAAVPDPAPAGPPMGPMSELRQLQLVSDRIARSRDLDGLLSGALEALDVIFGFSHAMLFLSDGPGAPLYAVASRGYGASGVGAEVGPGQGLVGTVAERRRMVRVAGVGADLRYGRAIRDRVEACGDRSAMTPEVPLPGLQDAQAQLALPLLAGDRLVGVLAVESRDPLCFDEWDEAFLGIVGNELAQGIDRVQAQDEEEPTLPATRPRRSLLYYRNDDCVFVDGEYLVRNVPGKILWKVLEENRCEGRTEFTNRELRLDPGLGLPPVKDNLESRLILLRRRLEEKCPEIRLVPVRRGRFALQLGCELDLQEREDGSARHAGTRSA